MSILLSKEGLGFFFFPVKIQTVNVVGFVAYIVPIATIHLCHCSMKEVINQMSVAESQ